MHICQTFQQSHSVTVWCNLCWKTLSYSHLPLKPSCGVPRRSALVPNDREPWQLSGVHRTTENAYIYPLSGVVHVTWIVCALGLTGNNIGTNWKKCLGGRERAIVIFYDLEKIYSDTRAEAEQTSWSSAPLCSALEEEKLLIAWHVTIVAKHLAHM